VKGPEIESAAVEPIEEIVECVPEEGPVGGGQRCDTAVIGQRRSGALQANPKARRPHVQSDSASWTRSSDSPTIDPGG